MDIGSWDEIRTAFHVARLGTVSAAAEVLGVHHATVIRHVDALEDRLGVKLFQRHARGYGKTEAGEELLSVAGIANDHLNQMAGRIKGRSNAVSGDLIITTVAGFAPILAPALARFQLENPDIRVRVLSDDRLFRLDYGEAHVAVRAGKKPQEPDNVVQHWLSRSPYLCASRSYVEKWGLPTSPAEYSEHRFVGVETDTSRSPPAIWMRDHVPAENFVFRAGEASARAAAIRQGVGIGFVWRQHDPEGADLVRVPTGDADLSIELWLVSHVDLHRTPKVQAILTALKQEALSWQT